MALLAGSIKGRTLFDSCKKPCTNSTLFNSILNWPIRQRQIKTFLKSCEEELKKVDFEGSSSCSCSASTIRVHADVLDCASPSMDWTRVSLQITERNRQLALKVAKFFFIFSNSAKKKNLVSDLTCHPHKPKTTLNDLIGKVLKGKTGTQHPWNRESLDVVKHALVS